MSVITLAEAKTMLHVNWTSEDTLIASLLDGVEEWVETYCALAILEDGESNEFADNVNGGGKNLWPRTHPILTLTSVLDRDNSNAAITATLRNNEARIWYQTGSTWAAGVERFTVNYTAGYTSATLPAGLKAVMLGLVFRAYNNRGGSEGQSASGFSENWERLATTDEMMKLRGYTFNRGFF